MSFGDTHQEGELVSPRPNQTSLINKVISSLDPNRQRNLLTDREADITFGTSVFHSFVHEWACQVRYNPRYNDWWGLSDGEGLERLWSFLSPLISSLRVSTRLHRLIAIQSRAEYYTRDLNILAGKQEFFRPPATPVTHINLQQLHRPLDSAEAQDC